MSGYPFSYPTQGGQPPPLNQQYPPYQPYTPYPHPASGYSTTPPQSQLQSQQPQTQQYPSHSNSYYANTQSAYEHNASSIPGLGAPQSAPPISMPYNGAWNQGGYGYGNGTPQAPFPAYSPVVPNPSALAAYPFPPRPTPALQTPQPAAPNQPASSNKQTKPAMQSQPMPQPMPQPKPQPTEQPKPLANNTDIQEDGEIDDGYFDDLYDDASKAPSVANETEIVQDKSLGHTSQDATGEGLSSFDTDMDGVSAAQKNPPVAAAIANTDTGSKLPVRDRSMSYSPRLSPDELRGDGNSESQNAIVNGKVGIFNATTGAPSASVSIQISGSQAAKNPNAESNSAAVSVSKSGIAPAKPFASVSEAHNEAKKAILRLLPHGVKYQTYIDEGFDAGVIKELFTQLHLPTGPAASASLEKPTASAKPTASDKPTATQNKDDHTTKPQLPQPTSADTMAKKQEERKDRIARLMAEKQAAKKAKLAAASGGVAAEPELALKQAAEKAKLAAATSSVAAAPESKNISNSSVAFSAPPAKPSVTKAEKNHLLALKVEALRAKGRESKKLAQKPVAPQVPKPDATRTSEPHQLSTMNTPAPVAVQSAAATPLSSAPQSSAASPALSTLSLISRAGAHMNQRKRPVAADFMDYPAPAVKRPSLANRENSSLVIRVSDDEDEDDDDIEMEVESATEDSPTPLQQTLTLNRRGPSIRDFPPLKDFPNTRQVSSPVAGMPASGSKNANADLQSKERAIMEMNRRIKELEARKQAKARSGNVTPLSPSAGGFTPTKQASKSASPRAAESKRQSRQHSVTSPVEKEGTLAYVKFITDNVKDDELRSALSSHGKLVYFDTNRPKNCAFIEYATPAACQAAIQASPITIAGDSIVIEPRRPKAGHHGSTNNNQTGNTTPSEQVLKTPQRVVAASNSGDDKTSPSAQLLQEAEAASAANPLPQPALSQRQTEDLHRNRNSSAQLSGKSAKALEKAERLRRMQEDMQRLQAEIDQDDDDDDDDDGDSVNEQRSEEVESTTKFDATEVMQGMLKSVVPEADRGDKVESTETAGSTAETEAPSAQGTSDVASEAQPMDIDSLPALPIVSDSDMNMATSAIAVTPSDQSATHTSADLESGARQDSTDSTSHIHLRGEEPSFINLHELDDYEPPAPKVDESKAGDGRVCADLPIFAHGSAEAARSGPQSAQDAETAREATDGTASSRPTSFTPYESPLRYYHAYRFHPNYNDGVQGGLKSLTYSNKIDPNREMCPDEWEGNDCPRGAACQFQHFQSIIVPDSEIILELGSSDEFSGEKKRQFNNGLREVVSSFQKSKVKDFRTIAEAILDFRRKFIGDPSKVLPLEGVST